MLNRKRNLAVEPYCLLTENELLGIFTIILVNYYKWHWHVHEWEYVGHLFMINNYENQLVSK